LFGAPDAEFAGRLSVEGSVHTVGGEISGELRSAGEKLTVFGASVDSLKSKLLFERTNVTVETLEIQRGPEVLRARASLDLQTSNIAFLTVATNTGIATFSGRTDRSETGSSMTLVPSQSLFLSPQARTLTCVSGFEFANADPTLEVKSILIDTAHGVRLTTAVVQPLESLSPKTEVIDLPFCEGKDPIAQPLTLWPRETPSP
jgi:hypothetical protein